eukprot:m.13915 g.13915  ORF g.13915 m.13915 type:complete len:206 (+) comp10243_c0_seq1:2-619(+)
MWEVATNCQSMPYPSMSTLDVATAVKNGYRLACPLMCPDQVFAIMASCWWARELRPTFGQLNDILNSMHPIDFGGCGHLDAAREARAASTCPLEYPQQLTGLVDTTLRQEPDTTGLEAQFGVDIAAPAQTPLLENIKEQRFTKNHNRSNNSPRQQRNANDRIGGASQPQPRRLTARQVLNLGIQDNQRERERVVEKRDYVRLTVL